MSKKINYHTNEDNACCVKMTHFVSVLSGLVSSYNGGGMKYMDAFWIVVLSDTTNILYLFRYNILISYV